MCCKRNLSPVLGRRCFRRYRSGSSLVLLPKVLLCISCKLPAEVRKERRKRSRKVDHCLPHFMSWIGGQLPTAAPTSPLPSCPEVFLVSHRAPGLLLYCPPRSRGLASQCVCFYKCHQKLKRIHLRPTRLSENLFSSGSWPSRVPEISPCQWGTAWVCLWPHIQKQLCVPTWIPTPLCSQSPPRHSFMF